MTCSTCDDLRRQLREAKEEIAEWGRGERRALTEGLTCERWDRWRRRLGLTTGQARMLIALVDAAPRMLTAYQLAGAATRRDVEALLDVQALAGAQVCLLRKALRGRGMVDVVLTVWGAGYRVEVDQAAALCLAAGDA